MVNVEWGTAFSVGWRDGKVGGFIGEKGGERKERIRMSGMEYTSFRTQK